MADKRGGDADTAALFLPADNSAPPKIHRKPVPAAHSSASTASHSRNSSWTSNSSSETAFEKYQAVLSYDPAQYDGIAAPEPPTEVSKGGFLAQSASLWRWELVSLVTSLSAFLAIVVILRVNQGRDVSEWDAPISINAVVAILSAILKGALAVPISDALSHLKWLWFSQGPQHLADLDAYDKASRSAWGSVLLITRFFSRQRLSPLASYGAFLTLMVLAIDPFSQASVSVGSCLQTQPTSRIIPRTIHYTAAGGHTGAGMAELDVPMQVAILLGLVQPPANSSESMANSIQCPTGNCTLTSEDDGAFSTLTMCHRCQDLSQDVNTTILETQSKPPQQLMRLTYNTSSNFLELNAYNTSLNDPDSVPFNVTPPMGHIHGASIQDGPWKETSIASFQGIGLVQKDHGCEGTCESVPFAFDCALRPCVKAFKANISNGIYNEQEVARWYLHEITSLMQFEVAVERTPIDGLWKNCTASRSWSPSHNVAVARPDDQDVLGGGHGDWYPAECVYKYGSNAMWALQQYIDALFQNTRLQRYSGSVEGEAWLKMLWNNSAIDIKSVDRFADGLATAIGGQIRRNPTHLDEDNGIQSFVSGFALQYRPCIRVRWQFLSFPGTLLILEMAFFIAVMILSYRSPWDGDWKSTTLPLLFQDINVNWPLEKNGRIIEHEEDVQKVAKHIQAKLLRDESNNGRWRLSTHS